MLHEAKYGVSTMRPKAACNGDAEMFRPDLPSSSPPHSLELHFFCIAASTLQKTSAMACPNPSAAMLRSLRVQLKRKRPSPQCRRAIATHTHSHHANQISVIRSNIDTSSPEFRENKASMEEVLARMRELRSKVEEGGTKRARDKHVAKGKMLVREYV